MDRVGAGLLGGADVLLGCEVAGDLDRLVGGARACNAPRSSGATTATVRDSELARGAEDSHGDLAAVGYEELADLHGLTAARLSRQSDREDEVGHGVGGRARERAAARSAERLARRPREIDEREAVRVVEAAVLGEVGEV